MSTTEPPRHQRPPFLAVVLNYLAYLFLFAICAVAIFLSWPMVLARLSSAAPVMQPTPAPPAAPAVRQQYQQQQAPADIRSAPVAPLPGIAQNEATSTAMYQATAQASLVNSAPPPNIDTTNDSAPLSREQRPADRQPAGENVPTAEPIVQGESGGMFGSKPVLVNPQATHTCRHGQVWADGKGCKNP